MEGQIYQTKSRVQEIKWKWRELNKEKIKDVDLYEISERDLKTVDPAHYPLPPNGYKIVPHKMWEQVEIIK